MNSDLCKPVTVDKTFATDPRAWLAGRMSAEMPWLLAHADDGVIWGQRQEDGTLKLSSDAYNDPQEYPALAVPLRLETLQQARLFGPAGELLLWRVEGGFAARLIADGSQQLENALPDETHLLWGDRVDGSRDGFAILVEGQRGFVHAPPIEGLPPNERAALTVRHYVEYDDQDQAYVTMSRLVDLTLV
ncbi:MAG: TIGR03984 family CRISPR-associated protein [Chloroflexi bacterium]|nr:TIGR03984 family CRISPR-associated protein [Chloroflexota bacterium]